jgi:signal transduction histidine kinase
MQKDSRPLHAAACVMPSKQGRAVVNAVAVAGVVLVAGFVTLAVFYSAVPHARGLPGLYHFLSATWGDGLALPVMSGALVFAIGRLPGAPHELPVTIAAGLLGACLGIATQVQWLRDDSPRLNWTLPRPHHFNVAGVYHAVFLTAMCTLTAALWTLVLLRFARVPGRLARRCDAIAASLLAAMAGLVFVVLLVLDSLPGRSRAGAATLTVTGVGVGLVLVVTAIVATVRLGRNKRRRRVMAAAQGALDDSGTSDRAVTRVAERYAVALRCGAVVTACIAGPLGPPDGVSVGLLAVVLAGLVCWAALFARIARRRGLPATLAMADAAVVLAVVLLQRHLVSSALIADGTSWTLMLASTAVFIPQLILRRPWTGPGVAVVVAFAYGLTEPVLTAGPVILLVQGAVTRTLMWLLRRGGRSADIAVAHSARAEREEQVRAERRADELEQYRRLHDTILATLTVVASGAVSRTSATLRGQAASDLKVLASLPDLPLAGDDLPGELIDLAGPLAEIALASETRVRFSGSAAKVPRMVADAITHSVSAALANVARYVGTGEAELRLEDQGDGVTVTVRDQGCGFDPSAVPASRRGIRESIIGRMESIGGAAELASRPGEGTLVTLWWPA